MQSRTVFETSAETVREADLVILLVNHDDFDCPWLSAKPGLCWTPARPCPQGPPRCCDAGRDFHMDVVVATDAQAAPRPGWGSTIRV